MTRNELERAIQVAEFELTKLTHETLRPSQGFKMRTHAPIMANIVTCIAYYKAELDNLPKEKVITKKAPVVRKEDK